MLKLSLTFLWKFTLCLSGAIKNWKFLEIPSRNQMYRTPLDKNILQKGKFTLRCFVAYRIEAPDQIKEP